MASKTYVSTLPAFSTRISLKDGTSFLVMFQGGLFSTENEDIQGHIEALGAFGRQITVKPEELIKKEAEEKAAAHKALEPHRKKAEEAVAAKAKADSETAKAKAFADKANAEAEAKRIAELHAPVEEKKKKWKAAGSKAKETATV